MFPADKAKRRDQPGTFAAALQKGGYLVIGRTESLPRETVDLFEPVFPAGKIYRTPENRETLPAQIAAMLSALVE